MRLKYCGIKWDGITKHKHDISSLTSPETYKYFSGIETRYYSLSLKRMKCRCYDMQLAITNSLNSQMVLLLYQKS